MKPDNPTHDMRSNGLAFPRRYKAIGESRSDREDAARVQLGPPTLRALGVDVGEDVRVDYLPKHNALVVVPAEDQSKDWRSLISRARRGEDVSGELQA
jgi:hypothetical protein